MATAREHMTADLAVALTDTEDGAGPFVWDGQDFTGIVNRQAVSGLDAYNSTAVEVCRLVAQSAGFPRPFPGGRHDMDGESWLVTAVAETLGSLTIDLERTAA